MGGDPARFWTLTPAVAFREMMALTDRRKEAYRLAGWQAWHNALWQRINAKKFPDLAKVMDASPRKASPGHRDTQNPDIMFANMKAIYLAFGGDPETLKTLQ